MVIFSEVSKYYGNKQAVKKLSFELQIGQVTALLGPNGAGKSTSIKMLTGYLPVSEGRISVCGFDLATHLRSAQSCIGYLPEGTPLYSEATVLEFLQFSAAARGLSKKSQNAAISRAMDLCGLQHVQHQLIDTLSKGYRQRTCFAQSILHDPQVLILDEPTDGLDPNQKFEIQQMIKDMGQNKCILLSTHIMSEAEFMADRILLLNQGKCQADGNLQQLREQLGAKNKVVLALNSASATQEIVHSFAELACVDKVQFDYASGHQRYFSLTATQAGDDAFIMALFSHCQKMAWLIHSVNTQEASLSELFQQATNNNVPAVDEACMESNV